jgi:hypothetical protein
MSIWFEKEKVKVSLHGDILREPQRIKGIVTLKNKIILQGKFVK